MNKVLIIHHNKHKKLKLKQTPIKLLLKHVKLKANKVKKAKQRTKKKEKEKEKTTKMTTKQQWLLQNYFCNTDFNCLNDKIKPDYKKFHPHISCLQ